MSVVTWPTAGGTSHTIYDDPTEADAYNAASLLEPAATQWTAGDEDFRLKYLINATRLIDRKKYISIADTFAKRNALQDAEGRYPFRLVSYELAMMLISNPDLMTAVTTGSNVKRVAVDGGPSVTFFNPTLGISGQFDKNIMDLIGIYLSSSESGETSGSFSSGTDGTHVSVNADEPVAQTYDLIDGLP